MEGPQVGGVCGFSASAGSDSSASMAATGIVLMRFLDFSGSLGAYLGLGKVVRMPSATSGSMAARSAR